MPTELHVIAPGPIRLESADALTWLRQGGMAGALLDEWPHPHALTDGSLPLGGELLLAWDRAAPRALRYSDMAAAGDWRELVFANYDMEIEGATLTCAPHGEAGSGETLLVVAPHGGRQALHGRLAEWLARQCGGYVVDPYVPLSSRLGGVWTRLAGASIANPDRASLPPR